MKLPRPSAPARTPGERPQRLDRRDGQFLTGACLLFLMASCWQMTLPGLQYDECLAASPAVNFVSGNQNADPMQIRPSVIHLFGRPLPVMQMAYIGPVKMLLYLPVFWLFGISPVTVRLLPTLVAVASLALTYLLCRRLWGRRVAVFASFLLALDPSFVFYVTRDVGPAALQIFFKLTGLVFFHRWWRQGRQGHQGRTWCFAAGALSFGLGVSHKADFLWVVGGVVLATLVAAPQGPQGLLERLRPKTVGLGGLAFLLGALPVVVFNVATRGHTFLPFLQGLARQPGERLGRFLPSLGTRLEQVLGLLSGDLVSRFFVGRGPGLGALGLALPLALVLSLTTLALLLWTRPKSLSRPFLVGGLLVYVSSVLVASCFSPTQLSGHHLLALYPMLQVAVAVALVETGRRPLWRRVRFDVVLVLLLVTIQAVTVVSIHRLLGRTGGSGFWSDTIYALSDDLMARDRTVAAMDWGFTNNLIVLSKGELRIEPVYRQLWRQPDDAGVELGELLHEEWLYLFHSPSFAWYTRIFQDFRQAAAEQGYDLVEEKTFLGRDARPLYQLFTLKAQGSREGDG